VMMTTGVAATARSRRLKMRKRILRMTVQYGFGCDYRPAAAARGVWTAWTGR